MLMCRLCHTRSGAGWGLRAPAMMPGDGEQAQRSAADPPQTHLLLFLHILTFSGMIQGNLGAQVRPLTCEARRADAAVATNKVDACGIVQAGGRYALIYVDFTAGPCNGVTFGNK